MTVELQRIPEARPAQPAAGEARVRIGNPVRTLYVALNEYGRKTSTSRRSAAPVIATTFGVSLVAEAAAAAVAGALSARQAFGSVTADGPISQPELPGFDQQLFNTTRALFAAGTVGAIVGAASQLLPSRRGFQLPPVPADVKTQLDGLTEWPPQERRRALRDFRRGLNELDPAQALAVARYTGRLAQEHPQMAPFAARAYESASAKLENFFGRGKPDDALLNEEDHAFWGGAIAVIDTVLGTRERTKYNGVVDEAQQGRDRWQGSLANDGRPLPATAAQTASRIILREGATFAGSAARYAAEKLPLSAFANIAPTRVQPGASANQFIAASMGSLRAIGANTVNAIFEIMSPTVKDVLAHHMGMVPTDTTGRQRGADAALELFAALKYGVGLSADNATASNILAARNWQPLGAYQAIYALALPLGAMVKGAVGRVMDLTLNARASTLATVTVTVRQSARTTAAASNAVQHARQPFAEVELPNRDRALDQTRLHDDVNELREAVADERRARDQSDLRPVADAHADVQDMAAGAGRPGRVMTHGPLTRSDAARAAARTAAARDAERAGHRTDIHVDVVTAQLQEALGQHPVDPQGLAEAQGQARAAKASAIRAERADRLEDVAGNARDARAAATRLDQQAGRAEARAQEAKPALTEAKAALGLAQRSPSVTPAKLEALKLCVEQLGQAEAQATAIRRAAGRANASAERAESALKHRVMAPVERVTESAGESRRLSSAAKRDRAQAEARADHAQSPGATLSELVNDASAARAAANAARGNARQANQVLEQADADAATAATALDQTANAPSLSPEERASLQQRVAGQVSTATRQAAAADGAATRASGQAERAENALETRITGAVEQADKDIEQAKQLGADATKHAEVANAHAEHAANQDASLPEMASHAQAARKAATAAQELAQRSDETRREAVAALTRDIEALDGQPQLQRQLGDKRRELRRMPSQANSAAANAIDSASRARTRFDNRVTTSVARPIDQAIDRAADANRQAGQARDHAAVAQQPGATAPEVARSAKQAKEEAGRAQLSASQSNEALGEAASALEAARNVLRTAEASQSMSPEALGNLQTKVEQLGAKFETAKQQAATADDNATRANTAATTAETARDERLATWNALYEPDLGRPAGQQGPPQAAQPGSPSESASDADSISLALPPSNAAVYEAGPSSAPRRPTLPYKPLSTTQPYEVQTAEGRPLTKEMLQDHSKRGEPLQVRINGQVQTQTATVVEIADKHDNIHYALDVPSQGHDTLLDANGRPIDRTQLAFDPDDPSKAAVARLPGGAPTQEQTTAAALHNAERALHDADAAVSMARERLERLAAQHAQPGVLPAQVPNLAVAFLAVIQQLPPGNPLRAQADALVIDIVQAQAARTAARANVNTARDEHNAAVRRAQGGDDVPNRVNSESLTSASERAHNARSRATRTGARRADAEGGLRAASAALVAAREALQAARAQNAPAASIQRLEGRVAQAQTSLAGALTQLSTARNKHTAASNAAVRAETAFARTIGLADASAQRSAQRAGQQRDIARDNVLTAAQHRDHAFRPAGQDNTLEQQRASAFAASTSAALTRRAAAAAAAAAANPMLGADTRNAVAHALTAARVHGEPTEALENLLNNLDRASSTAQDAATQAQGYPNVAQGFAAQAEGGFVNRLQQQVNQPPFANVVNNLAVREQQASQFLTTAANAVNAAQQAPGMLALARKAEVDARRAHEAVGAAANTASAQLRRVKDLIDVTTRALRHADRLPPAQRQALNELVQTLVPHASQLLDTENRLHNELGPQSLARVDQAQEALRLAGTPARVQHQAAQAYQSADRALVHRAGAEDESGNAQQARQQASAPNATPQQSAEAAARTRQSARSAEDHATAAAAAETVAANAVASAENELNAVRQHPGYLPHLLPGIQASVNAARDAHEVARGHAIGARAEAAAAQTAMRSAHAAALDAVRAANPQPLPYKPGAEQHAVAGADGQPLTPQTLQAHSDEKQPVSVLIDGQKYTATVIDIRDKSGQTHFALEVQALGKDKLIDAANGKTIEPSQLASSPADPTHRSVAGLRAGASTRRPRADDVNPAALQNASQRAVMARRRSANAGNRLREAQGDLRAADAALTSARGALQNARQQDAPPAQIAPLAQAVTRAERASAAANAKVDDARSKHNGASGAADTAERALTQVVESVVTSAQRGVAQAEQLRDTAQNRAHAARENAPRHQAEGEQQADAEGPVIAIERHERNALAARTLAIQARQAANSAAAVAADTPAFSRPTLDAAYHALAAATAHGQPPEPMEALVQSLQQARTDAGNAATAASEHANQALNVVTQHEQLLTEQATEFATNGPGTANRVTEARQALNNADAQVKDPSQPPGVSVAQAVRARQGALLARNQAVAALNAASAHADELQRVADAIDHVLQRPAGTLTDALEETHADLKDALDDVKGAQQGATQTVQQARAVLADATKLFSKARNNLQVVRQQHTAENPPLLPYKPSSIAQPYQLTQGGQPVSNDFLSGHVGRHINVEINGAQHTATVIEVFNGDQTQYALNASNGEMLDAAGKPIDRSRLITTGPSQFQVLSLPAGADAAQHPPLPLADAAQQATQAHSAADRADQALTAAQEGLQAARQMLGDARDELAQARNEQQPEGAIDALEQKVTNAEQAERFKSASRDAKRANANVAARQADESDQSLVRAAQSPSGLGDATRASNIAEEAAVEAKDAQRLSGEANAAAGQPDASLSDIGQAATNSRAWSNVAAESADFAEEQAGLAEAALPQVRHALGAAQRSGMPAATVERLTAQMQALEGARDRAHAAAAQARAAAQSTQGSASAAENTLLRQLDAASDGGRDEANAGVAEDRQRTAQVEAERLNHDGVAPGDVQSVVRRTEEAAQSAERRAQDAAGRAQQVSAARAEVDRMLHDDNDMPPEQRQALRTRAGGLDEAQQVADRTARRARAAANGAAQSRDQAHTLAEMYAMPADANRQAAIAQDPNAGFAEVAAAALRAREIATQAIRTGQPLADSAVALAAAQRRAGLDARPSGMTVAEARQQRNRFEAATARAVAASRRSQALRLPTANAANRADNALLDRFVNPARANGAEQQAEQAEAALLRAGHDAQHAREAAHSAGHPHQQPGEAARDAARAEPAAARAAENALTARQSADQARQTLATAHGALENIRAHRQGQPPTLLEQALQQAVTKLQPDVDRADAAAEKAARVAANARHLATSALASANNAQAAAQPQADPAARESAERVASEQLPAADPLDRVAGGEGPTPEPMGQPGRASPSRTVSAPFVLTPSQDALPYKPGQYRLGTLDGQPLTAEALRESGGELPILINGQRHVATVVEIVDKNEQVHHAVQAPGVGHDTLFDAANGQPIDPTQLTFDANDPTKAAVARLPAGAGQPPTLTQALQQATQARNAADRANQVQVGAQQEAQAADQAVDRARGELGQARQEHQPPGDIEALEQTLADAQRVQRFGSGRLYAASTQAGAAHQAVNEADLSLVRAARSPSVLGNATQAAGHAEQSAETARNAQGEAARHAGFAAQQQASLPAVQHSVTVARGWSDLAAQTAASAQSAAGRTGAALQGVRTALQVAQQWGMPDQTIERLTQQVQQLEAAGGRANTAAAAASDAAAQARNSVHAAQTRLIQMVQGVAERATDPANANMASAEAALAIEEATSANVNGAPTQAIRRAAGSAQRAADNSTANADTVQAQAQQLVAAQEAVAGLLGDPAQLSPQQQQSLQDLTGVLEQAQPVAAGLTRQAQKAAVAATQSAAQAQSSYESRLRLLVANRSLIRAQDPDVAVETVQRNAQNIRALVADARGHREDMTQLRNQLDATLAQRRQALTNDPDRSQDHVDQMQLEITQLVGRRNNAATASVRAHHTLTTINEWASAAEQALVNKVEASVTGAEQNAQQGQRAAERAGDDTFLAQQAAHYAQAAQKPRHEVAAFARRAAVFAASARQSADTAQQHANQARAALQAAGHARDAAHHIGMPPDRLQALQAAVGELQSRSQAADAAALRATPMADRAETLAAQAADKFASLYSADELRTVAQDARADEHAASSAVVNGRADLRQDEAAIANARAHIRETRANAGIPASPDVQRTVDHLTGQLTVTEAQRDTHQASLEAALARRDEAHARVVQAEAALAEPAPQAQQAQPEAVTPQQAPTERAASQPLPPANPADEVAGHEQPAPEPMRQPGRATMSRTVSAPDGSVGSTLPPLPPALYKPRQHPYSITTVDGRALAAGYLASHKGQKIDVLVDGAAQPMTATVVEIRRGNTVHQALEITSLEPRDRVVDVDGKPLRLNRLTRNQADPTKFIAGGLHGGAREQAPAPTLEQASAQAVAARNAATGAQGKRPAAQQASTAAEQALVAARAALAQARSDQAPASDIGQLGQALAQAQQRNNFTNARLTAVQADASGAERAAARADGALIRAAREAVQEGQRSAQSIETNSTTAQAAARNVAEVAASAGQPDATVRHTTNDAREARAESGEASRFEAVANAAQQQTETAFQVAREALQAGRDSGMPPARLQGLQTQVQALESVRDRVDAAAQTTRAAADQARLGAGVAESHALDSLEAVMNRARDGALANVQHAATAEAQERVADQAAQALHRHPRNPAVIAPASQALNRAAQAARAAFDAVNGAAQELQRARADAERLLEGRAGMPAETLQRLQPLLGRLRRADTTASRLVMQADAAAQGVGEFVRQGLGSIRVHRYRLRSELALRVAEAPDATLPAVARSAQQTRIWAGDAKDAHNHLAVKVGELEAKFNEQKAAFERDQPTMNAEQRQERSDALQRTQTQLIRATEGVMSAAAATQHIGQLASRAEGLLAHSIRNQSTDVLQVAQSAEGDLRALQEGEANTFSTLRDANQDPDLIATSARTARRFADGAASRLSALQQQARAADVALNAATQTFNALAQSDTPQATLGELARRLGALGENTARLHSAVDKCAGVAERAEARAERANDTFASLHSDEELVGLAQDARADELAAGDDVAAARRELRQDGLEIAQARRQLQEIRTNTDRSSPSVQSALEHLGGVIEAAEADRDVHQAQLDAALARRAQAQARVLQAQGATLDRPSGAGERAQQADDAADEPQQPARSASRANHEAAQASPRRRPGNLTRSASAPAPQPPPAAPAPPPPAAHQSRAAQTAEPQQGSQQATPQQASTPKPDTARSAGGGGGGSTRGTDNIERTVDGAKDIEQNPDGSLDEFEGARATDRAGEVERSAQTGYGAQGYSGTTRTRDGGHAAAAGGQAELGVSASVKDTTGPVQGQAEAHAGAQAEGRVSGHVGGGEIEGTAQGGVSAASASGSGTFGSKENNVTYGGSANAGANGIVSGGVSRTGVTAQADGFVGVEAEATGSGSFGNGAVRTQGTAGVEAGVGLGATVNAGVDDGVLTLGIGGRIALGLGIHFDLSIKIDFKKLEQWFTGEKPNPFDPLAEALNKRNGGRTNYSGVQLEFMARAYVKDAPDGLTVEQLLQMMADDGLVQKDPNGDIIVGATPTTQRGRRALARSILSSGGAEVQTPRGQTQKPEGESGQPVSARPRRRGPNLDNVGDGGNSNNSGKPVNEAQLDNSAATIDAEGLTTALNMANRGDSETTAKSQAVINIYGNGKTINEAGLMRAMNEGALSYGELQSIWDGKVETIRGYRFQPNLKQMSNATLGKMLWAPPVDYEALEAQARRNYEEPVPREVAMGQPLAATINGLNKQYFGNKAVFVGDAQAAFALHAYTAGGKSRAQAVQAMLKDGVLGVNAQGQLDLNLEVLWVKAKSKNPQEAQRARNLVANGIVRMGGGSTAKTVDAEGFVKGMNEANRGAVTYAGAEGMTNLYGSSGRMDAADISSMIADGTLSYGNVSTEFQDRQETASGIRMNLDLSLVSGGRISRMLVKSGDSNGDGLVSGKELAASMNATNAKFLNNPTSHVGDDQAQFLACGYAADGHVSQADIEQMIEDGVITKDAQGGLTVNSSAYQDMINSADPKRKDAGASRLAYSLVNAGAGADGRGLDAKQFRASLDMANRGTGDYGPALDQMFKYYAGADGLLDREEAKKMALDGALGTGSLNTTFDVNTTVNGKAEVNSKAEIVTGLIVKAPSMASYDSSTIANAIANNSDADGVDAQALQGWLAPGQNIDQLNVLMHGYSSDGSLSRGEMKAMIDEGVLKVGANGQLSVDPSVVFKKAHSTNPAVAALYQERLTNMLGTYGKDSEDSKSEYAASTYGVEAPERITSGEGMWRALNELSGKPVASNDDLPGIVESFTQYNASDHSNLRENNVRYAVASGAVGYDARTGQVSVNTAAYAA